MLKYFIRYSFFIMLFIAISSAMSFDDFCRDQDIDLHDVFSVKTLSSNYFIISAGLHGPFDLKTTETKSCCHCFSIFHPPRIS